MRRLIAACVVVAVAAWPPPGRPPPRPPGRRRPRRPVHPGVQTDTNGGQCTANFVFFDAANNVYIGQAAHCAGTDGNTATNGCEAGSLPLGTPSRSTARRQPGTIVYSSWVTMQAAGETDADTCQYNDIALIKLDPADYGKVNPSDPVLGRPDRHHRHDGDRRQGALVRQLVAAPRRHPAVAEGGPEPRPGRRRLDPPGLHRLARHPG